MADESSTASTASIKVRRDDYEAAKAVPQQMRLPISLMDVFTAQRLLWESATDKQRMEAIRKVADLAVSV